jgi:DNA polymerase-3 subunit gamma/tau
MALYHIHRPQTFRDILGQDHIKQTLREQVKSNRTAHAYLFSGPRGVGKTSMARILAKAVTAGIDSNGEVADNDIAAQITSGQTIDIIEIDAASHTGVDNVREQIIENAQFRPTTLPKKIFIIDEVHMLSTSAFNALLKVLEEPPAYVIFILATTEPHKIPATIISRCQRFDFRPIPYDVLFEHIKDIAASVKTKVDDAVLSRIVHKSDGCARDAVSLLDQIMSIGKKTITLDDVSMMLPVSDTESIQVFIRALISRDEATAFTHLQTECTRGTHMRQFAADCVSFVRYLMIAKTGAQIETITTELSPTAQTELLSLSELISYDDILILLDALIVRTSQIPKAIIPQLPLEMLVIWWCHRFDESTPVLNAPAPAPTPHHSPTTPEPQKAPELSPKKVAQVATNTTGTIANAWNAIIAAVESRSPSLVFILKMAQVREESADSVTISVSYGFHKDKLLAVDAKQIVESCIREVTSHETSLQVVIDATLTPTNDDTPPAIHQEQTSETQTTSPLHDLASAFGGTIIS